MKSRRDFMPFGEDVFVGVGGRTGDTGQKYSSSTDDIRQKFTGYQKDNETSLDFAEARMYENRYGRFTAVDPLLVSGKSANPQSFNRYVYVGNSPLVMTDPSGMIGDYYSHDGKWLGNDGKKDFKTYFATEVDREGKISYLDPRSIVPTTMEAVMRAKVSAVPLTPGTEYGAINAFASGGVQGRDDVVNGVPKGIGNFFIDGVNGLSGLLFRNAGPARLPDYIPNPLEIERFQFSTWKEAMYGNPGYTATGLSFSFAAAPFAAARAPSVVPRPAGLSMENLAFDLRHLRKHLEGTDDALKLGRKEGVHVFPNKQALGEVESAIFSRGSFTGSARGFERYGTYFKNPIGVRISPSGQRIPLFYGELKLKDGLYHIVPRTGPGKL